MYSVFLVDDEPFIVEGLQDIIDWSAYDFHVSGTAENGADALAALKETPVDLIMTDIQMPEMNGLELIRHVREIRPDVKVIILSGYNEFDYLKEGMKLGIENYLLKPVNIRELRSTLDNVLDKLKVSRDRKMSLQPHDMNLFRDNLMHRWMNGDIGEEEWNERSSLLKLRNEGAYRVAAVVRAGAFAEKLLERIEEQAEPSENKAKEPGGQSVMMVPYHDIEGNIVVVFVGNDLSALKRYAIQELETYLESDGSYGLDSARVTLGNVESVKVREASSYRNAKAMQEYFLLLPEQRLMDYDELLHDNRPNLAQWTLDWNGYAQLLTTQAREDLLARIEADFAVFRARPGMTPGHMQSLAVETVIRLKLIVSGIKHEDDPLREQSDKVIGQLSRVREYSELVELVQSFAAEAADAVIADHRSPVIREVLKQLEASYTDNLTLKELGYQYRINPVYLGQLFHKEMNETFNDYVNKFRMEKAKLLLKETHMKVHEIAKMIGYLEPAYFNRQFKRHVGISPTEFRSLT